MEDKIERLEREVTHWKANHAHEVERARLLKHRTDVPLERIDAYNRCSYDNYMELLNVIEMLITGLRWNIENNPRAMNECDAEALQMAQEVWDKHANR